MADEEPKGQEVWVFIGFIAFVVLVGLSIVVASNRWTSTAWAAIGSIGTWVQSIGVIVGLAYAGGQLHEARKDRIESDRRWTQDRHAASAARLAEFMRDDMTRAVTDLIAAVFEFSTLTSHTLIGIESDFIQALQRGDQARYPLDEVSRVRAMLDEWNQRSFGRRVAVESAAATLTVCVTNYFGYAVGSVAARRDIDAHESAARRLSRLASQARKWRPGR